MNEEPRKINVEDIQTSKKITKTPKKIKTSTIELKDIKELEDVSFASLLGVKSFIKKSSLILSLFLSIVIISSLYDAYTTISSMMQNSPILGVVYTLLVLSFVGLLSFFTLKEYLGYKTIKRVDDLQDRGEKLLNNPTKDVYIYAKEIIDRYKTSQFTDIANEAIELEDELENMLPNEVIDRLNEKLLSKLDLLAQKEIKKYATQTAISTAISPVAIIDAFLILSRAHVMVHKIASIYGYRPNLLGEILLFKKVFALLAFASVTDILANHSHDLLGTSLLSKLSAHSAQGVANGVLIARIGIGVIKACRPLKSKKRLDGFLESIITSISSSLFKRDK